MTKIVYNACYGGFALSKTALQHYKKLKGIDSDTSVWASDISRSDTALVETVELLGSAANGSFSDLQIVDIPAGTRYRIDEYDGFEEVMSVEQYHWFVA